MKYTGYISCYDFILYIKKERILNSFFFYSTVTLFARFWGLSISLFKFFAISTENIQSGINGRNGVNIGCDFGISIISLYISLVVSQAVITHNIVPFLACISLTFEMVFVF